MWRHGRVNSAAPGRLDACQRAKGAKGGRGRPRKEWWLGGKAISWEKGAGVTRARLRAERRESRSRDAHTRTRTHAYDRVGRSVWTKRVEHVVTAAVGVRERSLL